MDRPQKSASRAPASASPVGEGKSTRSRGKAASGPARPKSETKPKSGVKAKSAVKKVGPKTPATPRAKSKPGAPARARAPARATAGKASVGRPRRLSREKILETSLKLLEQYSTDGFTLARVADALGTVSMALYNYFPSREALLAELSNHICLQFRMPQPEPGQDWKKTLRDWLWTLRELGERYPVMFKITGFDGKTSAGWLRITRIVGQTLYEVGFREKDLALNNWLFCCQAIALVHAEVTDDGFHSPVSLSRLEELEPHEQSFHLMLRPYHGLITGHDVMEEGFSDLIANLERKLPRQ